MGFKNAAFSTPYTNEYYSIKTSRLDERPKNDVNPVKPKISTNLSRRDMRQKGSVSNRYKNRHNSV